MKDDIKRTDGLGGPSSAVGKTAVQKKQGKYAIQAKELALRPQFEALQPFIGWNPENLSFV